MRYFECRHLMFFVSLNLCQFLPCEASTLVPKKKLEEKNSVNVFYQYQPFSSVNQEDLHTIKIGAFYTADLLAEMDIEQLYHYMQQQVAAANAVLFNSGLTMQRKLVYLGRYPIVNQASMRLNDFLNTAFSHEAESVRVLAAQYGFDYITLLRPMSDPDYCGWAYYDSPYAAMQVGDNCLSATLGAHEWGHNDGADHDIANSASSPAREYGHGYNCAGNGTIMSTSNNWYSRHEFYSSPNITVQGEACGEAKQADVVRMLQEFQLHADRLGNRMPDRQIQAFAEITSLFQTVDEFTGTVSFDIRLVDQHGNSTSLDREANISLYTEQGTATANQDYYATAKTVTFSAGQNQQQANITVLVDNEPELAESFQVGLRYGDIIAPVGGKADVVIAPNDYIVRSTVAFATDELKVEANKPFPLTIKRQGELTGSILVSMRTHVDWLLLDSTIIELSHNVDEVTVMANATAKAGSNGQIEIVASEEFLGNTPKIIIHITTSEEAAQTRNGGSLLCLILVLLYCWCVKRPQSSD